MISTQKIFIYIISFLLIANQACAEDDFCDDKLGLKLEDSDIHNINNILKKNPTFSLVPDALTFSICSDSFTLTLKNNTEKLLLRNSSKVEASKVFLMATKNKEEKYIFYVEFNDKKYPIRVTNHELITLSRAHSSCPNNPNIWLGWIYVDDAGRTHMDRGYCPGSSH